MEERESHYIIARPPPPLPKIPFLVWLIVAMFLVTASIAWFLS